MKVSFGPDIILCGWLGLKHQLTVLDTCHLLPGHILSCVQQSRNYRTSVLSCLWSYSILCTATMQVSYTLHLPDIFHTLFSSVVNTVCPSSLDHIPCSVTCPLLIKLYPVCSTDVSIVDQSSPGPVLHSAQWCIRCISIRDLLVITLHGSDVSTVQPSSPGHILYPVQWRQLCRVFSSNDDPCQVVNQKPRRVNLSYVIYQHRRHVTLSQVIYQQHRRVTLSNGIYQQHRRVDVSRAINLHLSVAHTCEHVVGH